MNTVVIALILTLVRLSAETGDYALQNHQMATRKAASLRWALIHAGFYMIPFTALYGFIGAYTDVIPWVGPLAWMIQFLSHAFIDHYGLAARWCAFFGIGQPGRFYIHEPGHTPAVAPEHLRTWLKIRVDNIMHAWIDTACIVGTLLFCLAG